MEFLIEPRFSSIRGALYFNTDELNALVRAEYSDKFGFYQDMFGVYSYMRMTSSLKYKIHYPSGTPFKWQTHNSCAWTPLGTLSMNTKEIEPCKAKINEQFCYDEFLEGAYKSFLTWERNPTVGFSQAGVTAVNELARTIVKNATIGARMTLVAGQLFDPDTVTYKEGTPSNIQTAFSRTAGTCKGWIELCIETSAIPGNEHLQNGLIVSGDISSDGATWTGAATGGFVNFYDAMVAAAPAELKQAIQEGGIGGFSDIYYPMIIVSGSIYAGAYNDYLAQNEAVAQNKPRIERRAFQLTTERGARTVYVYFIDDTVIVPAHEVGMMEQHLVGTSHFAYLTLSGVIQMGVSFANLPKLQNAEVGVMMQVSEDAEDYGTHKFLAHALFATAINDTKYITGDYAFATPA